MCKEPVCICVHITQERHVDDKGDHYFQGIFSTLWANLLHNQVKYQALQLLKHSLKDNIYVTLGGM